MRQSPGLISFIVIALGLAASGYLAGDGFLRARKLDRTVVVKGLSEREVPADVAIWPVRFVTAGNNLEALYDTIDSQSKRVTAFLQERGFSEEEIGVAAPAIVDKQAQAYRDASFAFRFSAAQNITVYTEAIERVRQSQRELNVLGQTGIVISGDDYQARTQFLFNGLNELKPGMIEEATRNAREVAEKFAMDSSSILGKIKTARQGQFSISDRDSNTPHIKRVRVVSTIEYYLSD